jgi:hypothetical protein
LGETISLLAMATDANGRPIPSENCRWEIYYAGTKAVANYIGRRADHKLPTTAAEVNNRDTMVAALTVTDSAGRKSIEYTAIGIALPPKSNGK